MFFKIDGYNVRLLVWGVPAYFFGTILLESIPVQFDESICFLKFLGNQILISNIGANKHHRQRKVVSRSTKHSVVQSTYNLSRGWMMRRELRRSRAGRESRFSDDGPEIFEGTKQILVFICWCEGVPAQIDESICFLK